jgi:hypothetical protein
MPSTAALLQTPAPPRRLGRRLLLLALLAPLLPLCVLAVWAGSLLKLNDASLVSIGKPSADSYNCLVGGHFIRPAPAVNLNTEWRIDADLVPVMSNFRRQGWIMTSHTTTPVEMLPGEATAFDMGLVRVQVFRALALSYTADGETRVVASTRVVACPP